MANFDIPLIKPVHYKLVISGSMLEIYNFFCPIIFGAKRINNAEEIKPEKLPLTAEQRNEAILSSARRAKQNIRRLIYANAWRWFKASGRPYTPIPMTLTFREDVQDVNAGSEEFTKFIRRLNYEVGIIEGGKNTTESKKSVLKYLGVIQFQPESQRVHYHILFFNLPFMKNIYDRMDRIWGKGFFNINGKDKGSFKTLTEKVNIKKVIDYYSQYITQACYDKRLFGKKKCFGSRGLLKPITIYREKLILQIFNELPEEMLVFEKEKIPVPYLISFDYYRYNLTDEQLEKDILNFIDPYYEIYPLLPEVIRR